MSKEGTNKLIEFIVLLIMAVLIMGVILAIDINSSISFSIGALYCIVILYSWLLPGRHTITIVALACTALILYAAIFEKPIDMAREFTGINTVISLVVVWVCTALVTIARRSFNAFEDVRENLEAEVQERNLELENSRQKIRLITSGVKDFAIFSIDRKGIVDSWNLGAQLILGYEEKEIIGKSYHVFHSESFSKMLIDNAHHSIEVIGDNNRQEGWLLDNDGNIFWGRQTLTEINGKPGTVTGYTVVIEDLSDQRAKELEMRNRELEQFSSMVAHDLKSPLNSIRGLLNVLMMENREEGGTGHISDTLQKISKSSDRMKDTINNLLQYGKLGSQKDYEQIDCHKLLSELQADLSSLIDETDTKISIESLPTIRGNPTEIRLLFQNLISNAIKFRKEGESPEIKIWSSFSDGIDTFYVEDNGIGIPEKNQEEIFTIFKRLHNDENIEGSGIGLAHCMKIIKAHRGTIGVESAIGEGSTFYFTIPSGIGE